MADNPLLGIQKLGQSVWVDFLSREMMSGGELQRLIADDGLHGVTSNPTTFQEAIGQSRDYDETIRGMTLSGRSADEIVRAIMVDDVQRAADFFRSLYDHSRGRYGYVSIEVNPHLARDTAATAEEARRLWLSVARPNVHIKVPGTREGLTAIKELTAGGVNVNVTLLFGLPRYREVIQAYVDGIEQRIARRESAANVSSVASFFLSRIDVMIDPLLEARAKGGGADGEVAHNTAGQVAIASAKLAYQLYVQYFSQDHFRRLREQGAQPQNIVWASTGTKNPAYSDVKYVEPLIGPQTINTMPRATIDAYRDHGQPEMRLEQDLRYSREVMLQLARLGIDIDSVTRRLEDEGIEKFTRSYDSLRNSIQQRQREILAREVPMSARGR